MTPAPPPDAQSLRKAAVFEKAARTLVEGGDCDAATALNALLIAYLALAQRTGLLRQVPDILKAASTRVQQSLQATAH